MGLFDFAKDMGKRIFGNDEQPAKQAEKIQASLDENNPGIDNLKVDITDGVVSLSGNTESAESMEKAVLMAGNIQGVTDVVIENLDTPAPADDVKYYIIKSGDSLSKIAKQFYGNAMDYPKIFDANKEVIKDPDLIYPGQKIRIPS
jgi:nucleoid-associated protein YgaU